MEHSFYRKQSNIEVVPLTSDYSDEYRRLRNLDENRKWFFNGQPISMEDQLQWYKQYLKDDTQIMLAIIYLGSFVGACGLYNIDTEMRTAEFGRILIAEQYQRKGIAQASIKCVLDIAEKELGIKKVSLEVRRDNIPALNTYEKIGFIIVYENDSCFKMAIETKNILV